MADDQEGGDLSDILSQEDIDSLMEETESSSEGYGKVFRPDGTLFPESKKVEINVCDFRNPVFLTESEMRQVRIRHESFIHYMAARMSMFIRMDVSLKMSKLHTMTFQEFTETIPTPTFINLFKASGLSGVGVLSINPRLAMTLVNRMLGGKGHSVSDERYLTDIEMALVEDAVRLMLDEWCNQWEESEDLHASIVGRENNGRFLQTTSHDSVILVLDMEAALGDCEEQIQLGVPYAMIDPLIKNMKGNKAASPSRQKNRTQKKWLPSYSGINVPVKAEWDACELTVADLLRMREGDVIRLPQEIIGDTKVRVNNSTHFNGEVGIENDHVAVQINEIIEQSGDNKHE